ncbi:heavy-metal-associated domain-containing protein [Thiomicrorhabdus sp. zzn3]|uniref:heavy-metal-associated domain-containing protein n=1 Tax=Thiomicrorhabdus sp. zzn3 TaxID=3039775 RepID=UPI002436A8F6|nr:heavy-metal-associated domain-containing protein [Thiomicrorhabdus sp. zzn3]MDG6779130.1 heavy-metal-associated domain-containing protein [Thiomicrorhabdus sp. zzn3]
MHAEHQQWIRIRAENIKCGGCANSICKQLSQLDGIETVEVDVENGLVNCQISSGLVSEAVEAEVAAQLLRMGYPPAGSVEGIKAAGAKAKSFVSCAVGKLTENT